MMREWSLVRLAWAAYAQTGASVISDPLMDVLSAGVMATAGGAIFAGSSRGSFFALDAGNGNPLWPFPTGASISANPANFLAAGQPVAIAAGNSLFAFLLPEPAR